MNIAAASFGFSVSRAFLNVKSEEKDVEFEDGEYFVKKGKLIKVEITIESKYDRYNVAVVDRLPAGLEAENTALKTHVPMPGEKEEEKKDSWFEHQNLLDQRVECFASKITAGTYKYVYFARATTPGVFNVPPAKAEEMYRPQVYGRSCSTRMTIN